MILSDIHIERYNTISAINLTLAQCVTQPLLALLNINILAKLMLDFKQYIIKFLGEESIALNVIRNKKFFKVKVDFKQVDLNCA
jgi:hypothetical protein